MNVYLRIKKACAFRGVQISDIYEQTGFGTKTMYNWVTSSPAADKLLKVAKILDTTMEFLMGETEDINAKIIAASGAASIADDELELLRIYRGLNSQGKDYLMTAAASAASNAALTKKVSDVTTA